MQPRTIVRVFEQVSNSGIRLRFLTEINKENASLWNEICGLVEVRHLEALRSSFAISDDEYILADDFLDPQNNSKFFKSKAKEIVEDHRELFELLWSRAIPGEQRINELGKGLDAARTKLVVNPSEVVKEIARVGAGSNDLLICGQFGSFLSGTNLLVKSVRELSARRDRGDHKGIRWITRISDEKDIIQAKEFQRMGVAIRHAENLPPIGFAVTDKEFIATIERVEKRTSVQNLLVSSERLYVEHFQSFFEELWRNGVDSSQRIREIETGLEPTKIEILLNPEEALSRAWNLVRTSKEVLALFSTSNAFRRQVKMGALEVMREAVSKGSHVKILIPADETTADTVNEMKRLIPSVEFRLVDKSLQSRITIVIIDKKSSLIFELKDDQSEDSLGAVGATAFSNSSPIGSSLASIFESLWKQAQISEQLQDQEKLQRDFINIAAHEFRTPIQSILSYAEIVATDPVTGKEFAPKILAGAKRLQRLTEDILDVTRIESQTLRLNIEIFNLNEILSAAVEEYKNKLPQDKVDLLFEPNGSFMVEGDRNRIIQVVSNLLRNATEFTQEGKISIKIETSPKMKDRVVVKIIDTGTGIDPSILPAMFSKFATKSRTGTGLGLYISKSVIQAHHGTIWGENNQDGKGATFAFSLPIAKEK